MTLKLEPYIEPVSKIIGSSFFFLYIAYRIYQIVQDYVRYPGDFTIFSWLNWGLVLTLFFLFGVSYIIRSAPLARASGFWEIVFPFFCALLPFGVNESFVWAHLHPLFAPFESHAPWEWSPLSASFILIGDLLTIVGLFYLRRSFSIMTEARAHVRTGPYRLIRHPIYSGEILATTGFCLMLTSWFNIAITLLFVGCCLLRAHLEEKKLIAVFPAYGDYRKRTGAFFPVPRRLGMPCL